MNPTQKQFSLNRGVSRKQIPISFIFYAREDTEAARRIADALCSQGIEGCFDQNELRGG